jgi:hypothetical protein
MIIPIVKYRRGKVVAGKGLQSERVGEKTLLSVPQKRQSFHGALFCALGMCPGKVGVRVGVGTVNGLIPFLGDKKLDDPDVEPLCVKDFSKEGYAWVLVRVRTNETGIMTAAGKEGKYERKDLEIVAGTVPRSVKQEGKEWIAEHAIAVLRQIAEGQIEIRQIVYFDLQHGVVVVDGRVRHFFN